MNSLSSISFDNTEVAYQTKSNSELRKTYHLFRMMNQRLLVKIGNAMIQFLMSKNIPIEGLVKKTIFNQFCGGETLEETKKLIDNLSKYNVEVLLNYSVEGLEDADSYYSTYQKSLEMIHFAAENPSVRAVCIKFTGYAGIDLWTKVQSKTTLSKNEDFEYQQARQYIDHLCAAAVKADVQLFVDAEESWFQDAIDNLVDEMMAKYNKEEAFIFNTYQLYRQDKFEYLKSSAELAKSLGYVLGAKIVRGAYVEKENQYALKTGVPSPINATKELSDIAFDKALVYVVNNLEHISLCCASHNERSNQLLIEEMVKCNIPFNHKHISSSQLLGMSDNITYNLNRIGINTAKYVPFGPVKEVIPYLIRRAQENSSVAGQTSRELRLIEKEIRRRKL